VLPSILLILAFAQGSLAIYEENRDLYPLGEKEALMANTGIAASGSTGSVYFNPAGLVSVQKNRIS